MRVGVANIDAKKGHEWKAPLSASGVALRKRGEALALMVKALDFPASFRLSAKNCYVLTFFKR